MNSHYKVGMGALLLAIFAGISGGIAALFFQISYYISTFNSLIHPAFMQNLPQTHARMMIFFVLQPALMMGFGAWFVPILIAAKDMAFKSLNYIALTCLLIGFSCNFVTFFQPTVSLFSLLSLVFWALSVLIFSINMLISIINNRGPGVEYTNLPLFVWGQGIAAALTVPMSSLFLAALTRIYWANSGDLAIKIAYTVKIFTYPMLTILIVPAFGIIFHIVASLSCQTIRYKSFIISLMAFTTLCVFLFWNKILFNGTLNSFNQFYEIHAVLASAVYVLTLGLLLYAVSLLRRGGRYLVTPVFWSFGFMIILGMGWPYKGLVSQMGQIHSCISYALLFAVFAGFYFWMGKILGKPYSELLGKIHLALTFAGVVFTVDFFSLGSQSILLGAVFMGMSLLAFMIVVIQAVKSKEKLPNNYWGEGAITYEWQRPSPLFSKSK
ncbi:cbb3-type cytochrome c oxidase subunit I [Commensalibacter oyaizuii]|uniref:Cbb3-type cytochrome c oxidase subunit I n=1 Tax=Commensalibacter oyaizuii TaxID=3043873 RepID=A0ABT6PZ33_9PROT|nr:cbb3-type cytochrome c oxidase subunit I [Commensalibacter sp. TBRC 16381]MDI2089995.1 cbb3-type cytochrome c oxidase subunit I [Commensalibacter sp. TBRC 16381]